MAAFMSYFMVAGQCSGYSGWGWGNAANEGFCIWPRDIPYGNGTYPPVNATALEEEGLSFGRIKALEVQAYVKEQGYYYQGHTQLGGAMEVISPP
jgi:hypothetical protein